MERISPCGKKKKLHVEIPYAFQDELKMIIRTLIKVPFDFTQANLWI